MYAETFNVRPWLETPAKWLRWAMQSLTARNLTDVRYNLQQFWSALPQAKAQAKTQQDWSEILTLDAQSQWTLGNLYQSDASDVLKEINRYGQGLSLDFWLNPMTAINDYFLGKTDPNIPPLVTKLQALNKSAAAAFKAQVDLAAKATQAAQAAGVQSQAAATLTVGQNAKKAAANDAEVMLKQARDMSESPTFWDLFLTDFAGVPLWAWLAGGAAVLLLLTTAPAMAQGAAIRRALED
jgi:hypothetical protein